MTDPQARVFPLGLPQFDGLRRPLLDAVRNGETQLVDDYARAIAVEAEKHGVLNGCGRADIVDAAMDMVETSSALDAIALATERNPAADLPIELDLTALAAQDPEPPAFIVDGWLPQGEVTLFAGHGGSGKSAIALHLASCIATGRDFYGVKTQERRTGFLSMEDPQPILHWRLARDCQWSGIEMKSLAGRLYLWDAAATDGALMTETRDGMCLTMLYEWLKQRMQDVEVLIIDGASDAFDGNENQRAAVRRFLRAVRQLVPANGAVLLLAHVDKLAAKSGDTSQGYSGSTAWNNSVRARWYLRAESDDSLVLEVQKSNHAATGSSLRLQWNDEAKVFAGELAMPVTRLERELQAADDRERLIEVIRSATVKIPAAQTGQRTAYHVLCELGVPEIYRRDRNRFWTDLTALRNAGRVIEAPYRTADRKHRIALGVA